MTKVYLHIGTHKTGTSAIQAALHASDNEFLYPRSGRMNEQSRLVESHYPLAWSVIRRYSERKGVPLTDKPWLHLKEELMASKEEIAVLSSEFFWPATPDEVQKIRYYLRDFDVRVIVYFRNYWNLMLSSYKQRVKTGVCTDSFRQMMNRTMWTVDYADICDRWAEEFDVDVRVYDSVSQSLMADFSKAISCSLTQSDVSRNVSPSDSVIKLMLFINRLESNLGKSGSTLCHRARRNILAGRLPGRWIKILASRTGSRPIGNQADKKWLRENSREIRDKFLLKYVDQHDRHYFNF